MTKQEINPEYVMKYLKEEHNMDNPEIKVIENIFNTMKKYEDNHWWESNDSAIIGFYQLFESRLITNFSKFHEGLEKLLDRVVFTHEMGMDIENLRKEALEAKDLYINGIKHSDEYRKEKVQSSIKMLEEYCKKNGKQFLKFDLNEDSESNE